jgi:uncharacterized surface protein with fasciclin (FAS1) repeats
MSINVRSLLQATAVAALIAGGSVYATAPAVSAEMTVEVGGAPMYPSKNIVENAVNSKDHTTLVAAVQAAGLVETLQGEGPFTVFAPVNAAFEKLPAGHRRHAARAGEQGRPRQRPHLPRRRRRRKWSAEQIMAEIEKGGGKYEAATVEGGMLTFAVKDGKVWVMDESGNTAMVTIADVNQSNGVIHVIDTVLLPKMG